MCEFCPNVPGIRCVVCDVMQPLAPPTEEQLGWLETLIGAFQESDDLLRSVGYPDEDPSATAEMLAEVKDLLRRLRSQVVPESLTTEVESCPRIEDRDIPF